MELQQGSLEDKLIKENLFNTTVDYPRVLDLMLQASASVHYLHEKRVIHRDIATRNFLVDKSLKVLICDFGMSLYLPEGKDKDHVQPFGPVPWMAPESLQTGEFSVQTDIYMFGVMLVEVLNREQPYAAELKNGMSIKSLGHQVVQTGLRPRLNEKAQRWPAKMLELVEDCLKADPAQRPQTAQEINERLQQIKLQQIKNLDLAFITKWLLSGVLPSLKLPLAQDGKYDFDVDWGDGAAVDHITAHNQAEIEHVYASQGEYTVTITGTLVGFSFKPLKFKKLKNRLLPHRSSTSITDICQWGSVGLGASGYQFYGCSNLRCSATDGPDLAHVTDMTYMFKGATLFNGDLSSFDTSAVTDMRRMFAGAKKFNGDLSRFNTSAVTNMYGMFEGAEAFNGDLSSFDTSAVTNMSGMFEGAEAFNGNLSSFDTSAVTHMSHMFAGATKFNGNLSRFNTSAVTNMYGMFESARAFTGDLKSFDTSAVTNMHGMFKYAIAFNGDLSSFDTSAVTDMSHMFAGAKKFNGNLSSFDTSAVTDMSYMFEDAAAFNGDLNAWIVDSALCSMSRMFDYSGHTVLTWPAWYQQTEEEKKRGGKKRKKKKPVIR